VDYGNMLYELRKAKGSLLALCTMLDEFSDSVCRFEDEQSRDNAVWTARAASQDFDTWKFLIFSARDILSDQIAVIDTPASDEEAAK
jgi:hypothetical protein